jgi:2-phosphosulfolactate phosphatase
MTVRILHGIEGARAARGAVVVIDVLRAFTVAAMAVEAGVARLLFTDSVEETLALKKRGTAGRTAGERGGKRAEGFDYPNSPSALVRADLAGETLALTTTNGTAGLAAAAPNADRLYAGALVTAPALAAQLRADRDAGLDVSLVSMGRLTGPTLEDDLCAYLLEALLENRSPDPDAASRVLETTLKPINPDLIASGDYDPEDRTIAFQTGRCPFYIAVQQSEGLLIGSRVDPSDGPRRS